MFMAHCFNHLARNDTIELASIILSSSEGTVVNYFKVDEMTQSFLLNTFFCQGLLLNTEGNSRDVATILFGSMKRKTTPAKS